MAISFTIQLNNKHGKREHTSFKVSPVFKAARTAASQLNS